MFAEVIYENGEHSVMSVDSEEEAVEALKEQHRRAMAGERGLAGDPASPPAVRIKRVLMYDEHPGSLGEDQRISAKEAKAALEAVANGDKVSVIDLVHRLRNLTNPRLENSAPHESNFVMKESRELTGWEAA